MANPDFTEERARTVIAELPNRWVQTHLSEDWQVFMFTLILPLFANASMFALHGVVLFGWWWVVGAASLVPAIGLWARKARISDGRVLRWARTLATVEPASRPNRVLVATGEVVAAGDEGLPVVAKVAKSDRLDVASQPFALVTPKEVIVVDVQFLMVFARLPSDGVYFKVGENFLVAEVGCRVQLVSSDHHRGTAPGWLRGRIAGGDYRSDAPQVVFARGSASSPVLLRVLLG